MVLLSPKKGFALILSGYHTSSPYSLLHSRKTELRLYQLKLRRSLSNFPYRFFNTRRVSTAQLFGKRIFCKRTVSTHCFTLTVEDGKRSFTLQQVGETLYYTPCSDRYRLIRDRFSCRRKCYPV